MRVPPVLGFLAILTLSACTAVDTAEPKAQAPSTVAAQTTKALAGEAEHGQKFTLWLREFSAFARNAGINEATMHFISRPALAH